MEDEPHVLNKYTETWQTLHLFKTTISLRHFAGNSQKNQKARMIAVLVWQADPRPNRVILRGSQVFVLVLEGLPGNNSDRLHVGDPAWGRTDTRPRCAHAPTTPLPTGLLTRQFRLYKLGRDTCSSQPPLFRAENCRLLVQGPSA